MDHLWRQMRRPTTFSLGGATQRRPSLCPGAEEQEGQAGAFHHRPTKGSPYVCTVWPRRKAHGVCPRPPGCVRASASFREAGQHHREGLVPQAEAGLWWLRRNRRRRLRSQQVYVAPGPR